MGTTATCDMSVSAARVTDMSAERLPDSGRLAGIITTVDLARAGVTESRLRWLVGRGVLVSLGRGLYARAADARQLTSAQSGASALRVAAAVLGHQGKFYPVTRSRTRPAICAIGHEGC